MAQFVSGGLLCLFVIFIYSNFIKCLLSYNDLDLMVKTISGFGAIVGGFFVYFKWNDEKKRGIYERRLQEVYAPLIKLLIRQEQFRKMYIPKSKIGEYPILETECGTLKKGHFVATFEAMNSGLASPELLKLMEQYKLLLEIEKIKTGVERDAIAGKCKIIERKLVEHIIEIYNETVKILGLDKKKIILSEI